MQNIKKLYLFAMNEEAKDVVKNKTQIKTEKFPLYKEKENLYAITGIGKVNSAYVLTTILEKYNIDLVINLGFVGGSSKYKVGDVVAIEKARYHDFDATIFGYEEGQVPGLPQFYYSSEEKLKQLENKFPKTTLYTGDYFMTEKKQGDYVVDMEATGLYQVCYLKNKDIISVKIVSDIIGSEKHFEDYEKFEQISGSKHILNLYKNLEEVFE